MFQTRFSVIAGGIVAILVLAGLVQHFTSVGSTGPASQPATNSATQGGQQRIHAFVSGKVQGVGFRAFTQDHAEKLKLTGFVRNLKDGRVELVAEGPSGDIAKLVAKIKQGPPGARVDKLESTNEKPTGEFAEFKVNR